MKTIESRLAELERILPSAEGETRLLTRWTREEPGFPTHNTVFEGPRGRDEKILFRWDEGGQDDDAAAGVS